MSPVTESCFMCKNTNNCTIVDQKVVRQVEYLLPEINIFKYGIRLHVCSMCQAALEAFTKFKQFCVLNILQLEATVKENSSTEENQLHVDTASTDMEITEQTGSTQLQIEGALAKLGGPQLHLGGPQLQTQGALKSGGPQLQNQGGLSSEDFQLIKNVSQIYDSDQLLEPGPSTSFQEVEEIYIKEEPFEADFEEIDTLELNDEEMILKEEILDEAFEDQETNDSDFNYKSESESEEDNTIEDSRNISEYNCSVCNETFIGRKTIMRHMKKIHAKFTKNTNNAKSGKSLMGTCLICGKYLQPNSLTYHLQQHAGIKDYPCNTCNKYFTTKASVQNHVRVYHSNNKQKFPCTICKKIFASNSSLMTHTRVHYDKDKERKDAQCHVCKKFVPRIKLQNHLRWHGAVKKCHCYICDKPFINKELLARHMALHNTINCHFCQEKFPSKKLLNEHKIVHGIKITEKKFHCTICNKAFKYKCSLKPHMISHMKSCESILPQNANINKLKNQNVKNV